MPRGLSKEASRQFPGPFWWKVEFFFVQGFQKALSQQAAPGGGARASAGLSTGSSTCTSPASLEQAQRPQLQIAGGQKSNLAAMSHLTSRETEARAGMNDLAKVSKQWVAEQGHPPDTHLRVKFLPSHIRTPAWWKFHVDAATSKQPTSAPTRSWRRARTAPGSSQRGLGWSPGLFACASLFSSLFFSIRISGQGL